MFFNVFIQALAEVNIIFLIEFLAALITVPVIIAIVVVLFRLLVMIIVLLITSIRKLQKKPNTHDEVAEEDGQSAIEAPTSARKARLKKERVPGIVGAGGSRFREGSWQGSASCFMPTCYDRHEEMVESHA
jgi:hypothetical protein